MFVALEGAAEDVDVALSEPAVTLDSTYISLSSQRVIRIHNHSEIPVKFCWKNCADEGEEAEERARLHTELMMMWRDEEQRIEVGCPLLLLRTLTLPDQNPRRWLLV
jgi:hypothetical protein